MPPIVDLIPLVEHEIRPDIQHDLVHVVVVVVDGGYDVHIVYVLCSRRHHIVVVEVVDVSFLTTILGKVHQFQEIVGVAFQSTH